MTPGRPEDRVPADDGVGLDLLVVHPFLDLDMLIGRRAELDRLDGWLLRGEAIDHARVFALTGPPGIGKSALAWHWFHHLPGPAEESFAGRIWWDLGEPGAGFEGFVLRALGYCAQVEGKAGPFASPVLALQTLLALLVQRPFLVVLDGFDRCLRSSVGRLPIGFEIPKPDPLEPRRRLASRDSEIAVKDAKKLIRGLIASKGASRVLLASRAFPADLERLDGTPSPLCDGHDIGGLSSRDAMALWTETGARGSEEKLRRSFSRLGHHPGKILVLARQVLRSSVAGDFDAWVAGRGAGAVEGESLFSGLLSALSPAAASLGRVIAACRHPLRFDDLKAITARLATAGSPEWRAFSDGAPSDEGIVGAVDELTDRALIRRHAGGLFSMSETVRSEIWTELDARSRLELCGAAVDHFLATESEDYEQTGGDEGLSREVQLFHLRVELGEYQRAYLLFRNRILEPLLLRRGRADQCAALLERLLPDGAESRVPLATRRQRSIVLNALGLAYQGAGRPELSLRPLDRARRIDEVAGEPTELATTLRNLAKGLAHCGRLRAADQALERAAELVAAADLESQRRFLLIEQARVGGLCGDLDDAPLQEAMSLCLRAGGRRTKSLVQAEGLVQATRAQFSLWQAQAGLDRAEGMREASRPWTSQIEKVRSMALLAARRAAEALSLAQDVDSEVDILRAMRLRAAASALGDPSGAFGTSIHELGYVVDRARTCGLAEAEIPALLTLAELHLRAGEEDAARRCLDEAWVGIHGAGYRLFEADARVLLARLERAAGRPVEAAEAARAAFDLAWCGEPPFLYHWGLLAARRLLAALGEERRPK